MKFTFIQPLLVFALMLHGVSASETPELRRLRDSWVLAKKRAVDPINKKYLKALHELRTKYTKTGDLHAALAVETEISSVELNAKPQWLSKKQQVFNRLVSSTWKWSDDTMMTFNKDGSITSPHSSWLGPFEVRENGDIVVRHRSVRNKWVLRFEGDGKSAKVISEKGALKKRSAL